MKNLLLTALFLSANVLAAQQTFTLEKTLDWAKTAQTRYAPSGDKIEVYAFEGGIYGDEMRNLPIYSERIALNGKQTATARLENVQYEAFQMSNPPAVLRDPQVEVRIEQEKNNYFARVIFVPYRKSGSAWERANSFRLVVETQPVSAGAIDRNGPFATQSVLRDGDIYKFAITESGMYKLDYAYLKNDLKISNLDNIDPRNIQLLGNGGSIVPEANDLDRADDLVENAIQIVGEEDGKFNDGDYLLFYGLGVNSMFYRPSVIDPQLTVRKNIYDQNAFYFLKIGSSAGKRLEEQASVDAASAYISEEFDDYRRFEEDKVNLLDFFNSTQGSGKRWFGDYFYQTRNRDYSEKFVFKNVVPGSEARVRGEFAARCTTNTTAKLIVEGATFSKLSPGVAVSNNESNFAYPLLLNGLFTASSDELDVQIQYPNVSEVSEGWLDYIEVNVRRKLTFTGDFLEFRDLKTLTSAESTFKISAADGDLRVWDITNPLEPRLQKANLSGSVLSFGANTLNAVRAFMAFKNSSPFLKPVAALGKIENQDLHALDNLHMMIVYPPEFEAAAQRLATHRRDYGRLDVAMVRTDQIYNEFSSGKKDPGAIRDLARMLLERNQKFNYLLLFGDGSFDPRNISESDDNIDLVPVYETAESFDPISAHASDDFYGLLSSGEGGDLRGALDVAVGRLPARNELEANQLVDKIIAYENDPKTLGDWHLRIVYMGDDEDQNAHVNQADKLSVAVKNVDSRFNIEKIYFDAYQQISTSAGQRFPDAKLAINNNVFKGAFFAQYIGHGGPRGWAQERVIDNTDIAGWANIDRCPLIITATCTFGGYDDPFVLSGAEQALLKVNSGAIALYTTVRPVYISDNNRLTDAVQTVFFRQQNGWYSSVGEILKAGKNLTSGGTEENARRFTLLGDPAMFLASPEYEVQTTKINGQAVNAAQPDTIRALQLVEIEGVVTDTAGNLLPNFNGKITVTVFDKAQTLQTLSQDDDSPLKNYSVQRNVIFKGSATVTDGNFKIKFIVPKDINYNFGAGKISYYAQNGTPLDAAGSETRLIVGGIANDIDDDTPPVVQAFLNTDAFVFGGITDANPKILIKCQDDNGMNVTGTSLGHDLTAVLDGKVQEIIILNDFYESEQDNFKRGQAFYPLRDLAPGKHTLKVKGWDIANNSGEGYTEFVVAENSEAVLQHVLNYPNPFTTHTNFQFEHNLAGQLLDVQVQIFTVAGRLVKTITKNASVSEDGYRVTDIEWDGLDDFGDRLAKGVYLYRLKIRGTDVNGANVTTESGIEKLVILR